MTQFPETRESLIVQVKNPEDRAAWEQFVSIYRPVIFRTAVARGLQDADAQDLAQQVLLAVASAIGDWEKRDGATRFRHWLARVTRNAIVNALSRGPKDPAAGGSSVQQLLAQFQQTDPETESLIDWEYRRQLYQQAAKIVRSDVQPDTWRAFELTVIDGQSNRAAADQLGKSLGTIYTARCRIMQRLRDVIAELEASEA
ncbi:RNA polymerase sigma factor [Stieleria varia]|uniref:RNA polymerase sigma factor RpoE n=1 Tax=Stieleria varia TaxID=2528005 RepID=A0A5C6AR37_9BACT|nr:sigma-70 family RNA polymerase sigma factor [Stieleria varia]TWU02493.1 RNA polymerase sigma factor RpoE [Stieleria varia]